MTNAYIYLLTTTLDKKHFENIMGKGENAGYQHFLLFSQCFLPFPTQISIFNSLPNNAIFGMSKFKASSDDKFGVAEIMGFVFER